MVYNNINWLSVNTKPKFQKISNKQKRSGLKIKNIILKRINEYPKVTHHRDKWVWTKNDK